MHMIGSITDGSREWALYRSHAGEAYGYPVATCFADNRFEAARKFCKYFGWDSLPKDYKVS